MGIKGHKEAAQDILLLLQCQWWQSARAVDLQADGAVMASAIISWSSSPTDFDSRVKMTNRVAMEQNIWKSLLIKWDMRTSFYWNTGLCFRFHNLIYPFSLETSSVCMVKSSFPSCLLKFPQILPSSSALPGSACEISLIFRFSSKTRGPILRRCRSVTSCLQAATMRLTWWEFPFSDGDAD